MSTLEAILHEAASADSSAGGSSSEEKSEYLAAVDEDERTGQSGGSSPEAEPPIPDYEPDIQPGQTTTLRLAVFLKFGFLQIQLRPTRLSLRLPILLRRLISNNININISIFLPQT